MTDEGPVHDLVVQRNTDDATFLKERAELHSTSRCSCAPTPTRARTCCTSSAPPTARGSEPISTYMLAWGGMRNTDIPPSLIEFKPDARRRGPGAVRDRARLGPEDQEEDQPDGDAARTRPASRRSTTRTARKPPPRSAERARRSAKSSSIAPWRREEEALKARPGDARRARLPLPDRPREGRSACPICARATTWRSAEWAGASAARTSSRRSRTCSTSRAS